ncbi:MAG: hypothetical protein O6849_07160 [Candidatus Dadabacteria bacterium]|nr:hypothetical protein [Candidatus Dadabacteria bacterium]
MPLFEVDIQNRVVKNKFSEKRIKGRQGDWYDEQLYYLADSEEEAKEFAKKEILRRKIIGVSGRRNKKIKRQIEILDIRRFGMRSLMSIKE